MRWLAVAALSLVLASVASVAAAPSKFDEQLPPGYTAFAPSPDTRIVYVSSSLGNDSNDGLSDIFPVATLAKGQSLLRNGFPDWLLLRRDDVWVDTLRGWNRSGGRSTAEPMLLYSYGEGDERPRILSGTQEGFRILSTGVSHLAIVGIHFNAHANTGFSEGGIVIFGPASDILIEDCLVEHYSANVIVQRFTGAIDNVRLRRNIIVDAYSTVAHSGGIFIQGATGVTVEENLFDHNGWRESDPVAVATVFNHNVYCQSDAGEDFVFRGNISARAASHGIQARAGGIVEDNLFVRNPLGLQFGGGDVPRPGGVTGIAAGNVVLEGTDITPNALRGNGIEVLNIDPARGAVLEGNIVSTVASGRNGFAITCTAKVDGSGAVGVHGLIVQQNIVHDWGLALRLSGPLLSANVVRDNVFEVNDGESYLVEYFLGILPDASAVSYSNNRYESNAANLNQLFHVLRLVGDNFEQASYGFPEWFPVSEETDPVLGVPRFRDPDRSVASYHGHLGRPATFEAFIAGARAQSRQHYQPEYSAVPVLEYIREGFEEYSPPVLPEGEVPASSPAGMALAIGCILAAGTAVIRCRAHLFKMPPR